MTIFLKEPQLFTTFQIAVILSDNEVSDVAFLASKI